MTNSFNNKTVLITGGANGIGQAVALAFAREGANTIIADIDQIRGTETVTHIRRNGGIAEFVSADMTSSDAVSAMVDKAVSLFGRLDCAFNNAGIAQNGGRIVDTDMETFDRVISINVKGVLLCMKYELRQMQKQGFGAIVNAGSIASFSAMGQTRYPGNASAGYIASKHAVIGLTRAAAMEHAKDNIRVNAVCPGVVRTQMFDNTLSRAPSLHDAIEAMHPMGRIAEPADVAHAVLWLCSENSGFVTGHALAVDGGYGAA